MTTAPHRLSARDARRIAVRAQVLTRERPADVLDTVERLAVVQTNPTNAVAPSEDLVMWSRLGPSYDPRDLRDAIDELRIIEYRGLLLPAEDIALHRAEMAVWPGLDHRDWHDDLREWVDVNNACRRDILDRLRSDGPLPSRELPDTCVVPWKSSGWNDNRNVRMMLSMLVQRGEVASAGYDGRDRLWDLASRIYPDDPVLPEEEARVLRAERRLRALGIARPRGPDLPVEPTGVGDAGEPAVIAGVEGEWRVDPERLGEALGAPFRGRAALLSPFDRLLYDRKRTTDIFGFEYLLEMYKPAAKRRWGYYALPILYGDRLVGKLDATADRTSGVLRVNAIHEDAAFSAAQRSAVHREIAGLAGWLRLDLELPA